LDVAEIRQKVKQIIANVTNIPVEEIADDASFVDDLDLDSLSLLEIGVDVDYEFKLGVPEEELAQLRTVEEAVQMAIKTLAAKDATAEVA